jgi:hypothetical protein
MVGVFSNLDADPGELWVEDKSFSATRDHCPGRAYRSNHDSLGMEQPQNSDTDIFRLGINGEQ